MKRNIYIGAAFIGADRWCLAVAFDRAGPEELGAGCGTHDPPFRGGRCWPKPLPNHWIMAT